MRFVSLERFFGHEEVYASVNVRNADICNGEHFRVQLYKVLFLIRPNSVMRDNMGLFYTYPLTILLGMRDMPRTSLRFF